MLSIPEKDTQRNSFKYDSVETLETSCFLREFLFHIMSIPDVSSMEISCFLDIKFQRKPKGKVMFGIGLE